MKKLSYDLLRKLKEDIRRSENELRERSKELECIYGIAKISEESKSLDDTLTRIANLIPLSLQYPHITCVRIVVDGFEYNHGNFKATGEEMTSNIVIDGVCRGKIEVHYTAPIPPADEGPFLYAERRLIYTVAERIGKIVKRVAIEKKLRESNKNLRELFEHLQIVRERERKEIASELHDELGHALTSFKLDLRWIQKHIDGDKSLIFKKTEMMKKDVDKIINDIRDIVSELRPALLDDFGLIEALKFYGKEYHERTGICCRIISRIKRIDIDKKYSAAIFRIFQELLNNVIKHARADRVEVFIEKTGDFLKMTIRDNGIGIREEDLCRNKSFGIQNIKERMDIWGGSFIISGKKGTVVNLSFPLLGEIHD